MQPFFIAIFAFYENYQGRKPTWYPILESSTDLLADFPIYTVKTQTS